ncbi:hypothetical protein GCM10018785_67500 [Streptomyces longispororuber]|uniref:DUF4239 domain-containing protein n=1 Tax=Streptomyces longispororuber TaxID=68230 RepID=A0A919AA89_9ACTN|nr:DUF4239 domain-containing protein [Streptomyces longispororuber]GHE91477.1 hypothetical protein GCM10018785_67500 [Streptomyces longispororuber]
MEIWLLNHLSTPVLALIIVGGIVALALAGSVLAYRWHPALAEGEHNDMVGAGLGMFAAIYGIILAFVVVTLWTEADEAETVVANESTYLAQMVRDSRAFPPAQRARMEGAVSAYVHAVAEVQWPLMREGRPRYGATEKAMDDMFAALNAFEPRTERQKAFHRETISDINKVVAERRARITKAQQSLPGLFKVQAYGGALVVIPLTFLYGNKSRRVRLLFVGSVAALVGFSLLLVLVLDHPFSGDISVPPDAYKEGALAKFW